MNAQELLTEATARGIRIRIKGGELRCEGLRSQVVELLPRLKEHKAALLGALQAQRTSSWNPQTDADEAEDLREYFEERAGSLEYDAGLPRPEAELEAARMTATYAQNKRYLWRGLRVALEGYSELLARLPHADGPVDSLPLGVSRLAVFGRRIMRQGVFTNERRVPDKAGA